MAIARDGDTRKPGRLVSHGVASTVNMNKGPEWP